MELYIEYVLIDNLVIDFMILKLIRLFFKIKVSKLRQTIYYVSGVLFAFLLPYILDVVWLSVVYKFIVSIIMVILLRKYENISSFIKYYLSFLLATMIMAGVIYGVLNLFQIDGLNGVKIYSFEFPMSVLLVLGFLSFWLLKKIIKTFQYQFKIANYLYEIKMFDNDSSVEAIGFFDSGNNVIVNGQGVNIITLDLFMKLYKDFPVEKLLFRNVSNTQLKNASYINIESLSSSEKFLSFTMYYTFFTFILCSLLGILCLRKVYYV